MSKRAKRALHEVVPRHVSYIARIQSGRDHHHRILVGLSNHLPIYGQGSDHQFVLSPLALHDNVQVLHLGVSSFPRVTPPNARGEYPG